MSIKSDLQVFVEMNEADVKNGTTNLGLSVNMIRANKVKRGAEIVMGCDEGSLMKLMDNSHVAVMLIVNMDEYRKIKG